MVTPESRFPGKSQGILIDGYTQEGFDCFSSAKGLAMRSDQGLRYQHNLISERASETWRCPIHFRKGALL